MSDYRSRLEAALQARYKGTPGKWTDDIDRETAHTAVCEALEDMLWPISPACQFPTIERCKCAKCVEGRSRAALRVASGEEKSNGSRS